MGETSWEGGNQILLSPDGSTGVLNGMDQLYLFQYSPEFKLLKKANRTQLYCDLHWIDYSPDGKLIYGLSVYPDSGITVFRADTLEIADIISLNCDGMPSGTLAVHEVPPYQQGGFVTYNPHYDLLKQIEYSNGGVSETGKLYVANHNSKTVSVIDLATNNVIKTIPVTYDPVGIVMSPDNKYVYVVSHKTVMDDITWETTYAESVITVIDTAQDTVVQTKKWPDEILYTLNISPDGNHLFVAEKSRLSTHPYQLWKINTSTLAVTKKINGIQYRESVVFASDGLGYVYESNDVMREYYGYVFDPVSGSGANVLLFGGSGPSVFTNDGKKAYMVVKYANSIVPLDTASKKPLIPEIFEVGAEPVAIVADPVKSRAYVLNAVDNSVSVVDMSTASVIDMIGLIRVTPSGAGNPNDIAVGPDGNTLYVSYPNGIVTVVDLVNKKAIKNVNVGDLSFDMAIFHGNAILPGYSHNLRPDNSTTIHPGLSGLTLSSGDNETSGTGSNDQQSIPSTKVRIPGYFVINDTLINVSGNNVTAENGTDISSVLGPNGKIRVPIRIIDGGILGVITGELESEPGSSTGTVGSAELDATNEGTPGQSGGVSVHADLSGIPDNATMDIKHVSLSQSEIEEMNGFLATKGLKLAAYPLDAVKIETDNFGDVKVTSARINLSVSKPALNESEYGYYCVRQSRGEFQLLDANVVGDKSHDPVNLTIVSPQGFSTFVVVAAAPSGDGTAQPSGTGSAKLCGIILVMPLLLAGITMYGRLRLSERKK